MSRYALSLLAVFSLALVVPRAVRADDELARFAARSKLAAQKLAADVDQAITRSRSLQKTDPTEAKTVLITVRQRVRDSEDLQDDARTRLTGRLNVRLREVGEAVRIQRVAEEEAARAAPRTRPTVRTQPGASGLARDYIERGRDVVGANDRFRREREKAFTDTMRNVDSSAVPVSRDMTYAKNWAELSKLRAKTVGPKLTPQEVALLKTLNSTLSVDFAETSLKDALAYIQERTGLSIIVDPGALREAMVEYDDPVSFKVKRVTVRTILRKVLGDKGLAYVLREGTVQVVTQQRARELMITRTYPIDDLIGNVGFAQQFGPFVAQAQMIANARQIINVIVSTIEPAMWAVNGGPATISFYPAGRALIVRAPAEMHYSLGSGLIGR